MSRKKPKGPGPNDPAVLILFDYGGHTVWFHPEEGQRLLKKFRKKHVCYLVRRKVRVNEDR